MRAVLCGYYGMGNGGDEALLATLLQMLPTEVTPVVLSGNPPQTRARYGVEAYDRKGVQDVLQALQSADAFIFGGGSLIQDTTSFFSPIYYAGVMGLAQRSKLRTLAWAQGIGPLQHPFTRWLAEKTFSRCDRISVRDSTSAQLLSDWQIPCLLAPDPVWALEALPAPAVLELPEPRIAISLRPHPSLTPPRLACIIEALKLLQDKLQASFVLLPFQPIQDGAIAQQLATALPGPTLILERQDPRTLKGVFKHINFALSMRLHGLIMAASEGCRCSALSYDPKVDALMEDVGLPGWNLAQLPEQPTVLFEAWLAHCTQHQPLSTNQRQSLRDRALIHRDLLHTTLAA